MAKTNNDLATKQFVKDTVKETEKKLTDQINETRKEIGDLRNDINGLAKLVKNSIDEKLIQRYRQEQVETKVDNHEKRITKLEKQSANA